MLRFLINFLSRRRKVEEQLARLNGRIANAPDPRDVEAMQSTATQAASDIQARLPKWMQGFVSPATKTHLQSAIATNAKRAKELFANGSGSGEADEPQHSDKKTSSKQS